MNNPNAISIDEFLVGQPATALIRPEDSAAARKRRDAHERYYTLAQVNRMMHDLHQLRSQRDSERATHDRSCHDTLFRLALFGALGRGEDGRRVLRVGAMAALLARSFGCPLSWCERLYLAAPLHDVGLSLCSSADAAKTGCVSFIRSGQALLGGSDEPALKLAAEIALTWQERWDGNRKQVYGSASAGLNAERDSAQAFQTQAGLALDSIPLGGRIVALIHYLDDLPGFRLRRVLNACQYAATDTLRLAEVRQITEHSHTSAKNGAWTQQIVSNDQLATRIRAESGKAFDPQLVEQLVSVLPSMRQIRTLVDRQYRGYQAPDWGSTWWSAFVDDGSKSG